MNVCTRKEVPVEETWDLSLVYADEKLMWQELEETKAAVEKLAADYQGNLTTAENIVKCLDEMELIWQAIERIYSYTGLAMEADYTDNKVREREEKAGDELTRLQSRLSFVDSEILLAPEEELEKLAKECDDIDERNSGGKPAWAAIRKLQDNRALARLLYRDIPRGSFKNNAYGQPDQEESLWIKWTCAILERMDGNEKDMVKFIVSGHGGHQIRSETIAFKKIKSTEGLLKVALSKNSVALDAAKLLGDEFIDKLRESEDNKVRGYADSKWVDRTISNASETEAFEVMRIKMESWMVSILHQKT